MTPDGLDALRAIYEQAANRHGGKLDDETLQEIIRSNGDLADMLHLTDGSAIQAVGMQSIKYENTRYGTKFENGVVVLDLIGPIYPRANMMTMSGAVSLQQFTQDFVRAYNDPDVKGIVMNIDSPGGDARGLSDATNLMYGLSKRRKKPVKAFASGYMASASYYIGAIAQEVVGSKGSYDGSIGTVLKAQALPNGQYEITSSQSPYKRTDPATEEGRNVIQEFVDDVAQIMVEDIAAFRGIAVEKVLSDYGQGKVFAGPRAKKQGLIDSIGTLGSVVEAVAKEAQTGSFKTKRKVSAQAEALLSFTSEDEIMGLKDLVKSLRASDETVFEEAEGKQAQPKTATEESEDSVAEGAEGQEEGTTKPGATAPVVDPKIVQAKRDELETQFSEKAELFATRMTLKHRILPAEQAHAASDLLIAMIDDSVVGGTVRFVNAEGEVVDGTREEAVRARYEARPQHSLTQKAVAGLKDGSVQGKVLAEEDKDADEKSGPMSAERKNKLMGLTEQGRRASAAQSSRQ